MAVNARGRGEAGEPFEKLDRGEPQLGDFALIAEVPTHVDVAALALRVNARGALSLRTTVLLTPEEADKAAKKRVTYRAPEE